MIYTHGILLMLIMVLVTCIKLSVCDTNVCLQRIHAEHFLPAVACCGKRSNRHRSHCRSSFPRLPYSWLVSDWAHF